MQRQKPSDLQLQKTAEQALKKLKQVQKNAKWEQFGQKPCTMLKMQIQGRFASRGEAIVNYPIKKIFDFLNTNGTLKKLNNKCKELNVLYQAKQTSMKIPPLVNYMQYAGIWPVADRDFVSIKAVQQGEDICYIASLGCDYPFEQKKGVVRGKCHIGGYVLKKIDQNSTLVIYISDVDIAGSIPAMLKNQLAKNQGSIAGSIEPTMKKQFS